jgi:hypothetical protein
LSFFPDFGEVDHVTLAAAYRRVPAAEVKPMAEPSKRMPDWLTTDILIIVVEAVIVSFVFWIAP